MVLLVGLTAKLILHPLKGIDNAMIVKDNRDRTVVLISNEWQMGWVQERNPDVTFFNDP